MRPNIFARILLWPFSVLYGIAITSRNLLYDIGIVKSTSFSIPIINVGNLSIGGAGKTPHVEYLLSSLMPYMNLAVLSRGYKRKTKGFRFAGSKDDASTIGDEPYLYYRKYPEVTVTVGESRTVAIPEMLKYKPDIQAVILDDAYQHRSISPHLNILLTTYNAPFTRDTLLPAGRLREYRNGYSRAHIIIVTKCPETLSIEDTDKMVEELKPFPDQKVFFSRYEYHTLYALFDTQSRLTLTEDMDVMLISAIADTQYLHTYLEAKVKNVYNMEYEDHHVFSEDEIDYLEKVFIENESENKIIITTEKDASRLSMLYSHLKQKSLPIFVLPIQVKIMMDARDEFDQLIKASLLNFKS